MRPYNHFASWATAVVLSLSLAVAGCGGDDDDDDDDIAFDADLNRPDAPTNTPDATPAPDAPSADFCTPQSGTNLRLVEVASGLTRPLYVTAPSGDPRLFIVEQPGTIRIVKNGELLPTPFLDIESRVDDGGNEQGLLGLAFHPNYATNRRFFVNYTAASPNDDTVIAEYQVSAGDPDVADANEVRLLTIGQPQTNHNGGWIGFGPDGYLYISTGDGGGGGDDDAGHVPGVGNGQSLDTLLGKLLRIDVDTGDPYGIPADNPFVGVAGEDEIWAYGLRNPWRSSFDRNTGDLYIGDVGQNMFEEIDYQPASSTGGENYGWRILEGDDCFNPDPCSDPPNYVPPVVVEGRCGAGASITGGYVYRGACLTDYVGTYFYADFLCDYVKTFEIEGGAATNQQDISSNLSPGGLPPITSFGEDAFGELYFTAFDGSVYRIEIE